MPLQKEEITKLAKHLLEKLAQNKLITVKTSEKDVLETIQNVLLSDVQAENDILKEVDKTMDKFKTQIESGEIDYEKMYGMVKKQIMKDKQFIL